jgi:apolipoprotein N-acyltransferase
LLNGQGEIISSYDKMRLLPFGEYLPLEGQFSWPRWLAPQHGNFIAGTVPTVFELPQGRFGVVICWENLFSGVFRQFVTAGAQFMVNLTNESWFDKTAHSKQILSMSVFRAVEHRIALLRVANTGITCLIDPLGRVQARVKDAEGQDQMVAGILTVAVPAPLGPTFYTRYGDVFAYVCLSAVVLCMLAAVFSESKG